MADEEKGIELNDVQYTAVEPQEKWTVGREDFDYVPEVSLSGLHRFWTSICRVEVGARPPRLITAAEKPEWGFLAPYAAWLDNVFRVTERGSTFWTEIIGEISLKTYQF